MPNEFCEVAEVDAAASTAAAEPARSNLLQHYEAIAQSSCAMLAAARAGDWIEVERLEERCGSLIAILKADQRPGSLSAVDDKRRMVLLRQILADDAFIRGHAEPWLEPMFPFISTPRLKASNESA